MWQVYVEDGDDNDDVEDGDDNDDVENGDNDDNDDIEDGHNGDIEDINGDVVGPVCVVAAVLTGGELNQWETGDSFIIVLTLSVTWENC